MTLCALLALSVLSSGYLILASGPRLVRCTDLARSSRLAHEAMLDQETGLRGWLATGDAVFLDPYRTGRESAEAASQGLLKESSISPRVTQDTVAMLLARQAWNGWAEKAVHLQVSATDRTTGRLTAFLLEGKRLFDSYRDAETLSTSHILSLRDRALRDERAAIVAMLGAYLLLLAGAGLLALRRRRRLQHAVVRPISELLSTIDALRGGDLAARSAPSGMAELDAMGRALGDLAADLQGAERLSVAREDRLALLAARFETVVRVARETSGSLSVRYVSESVTYAAAELLGAPATLWMRIADGEFRATCRSQDPHGATPPPTLVAPALVAGVAADARADGDGRCRAYPMVLAGNVVGVLESAASSADQDAEQVLEALLSTAAAALESARLHSSARELAHIDPLTQLPNRRRLDSDLETEWDRCRRYGRPLSFVMVDLDHFKALNDEHGHVTGDEMLRAVAKAVTASLRTSDTAYRYGGEELALLLRETGLGDAAMVAERVREAVADVRLASSLATVTASMGVADLVSSMAGQMQLVEQADAALYEAKLLGRDRVELARRSVAAVTSAG